MTISSTAPGEISAVLQAGAHPRSIIYANPNKAPDAILKALSLGVTTMTFDSVAELTKVSTLGEGDRGRDMTTQ